MHPPLTARATRLLAALLLAALTLTASPAFTQPAPEDWTVLPNTPGAARLWPAYRDLRFLLGTDGYLYEGGAEALGWRRVASPPGGKATAFHPIYTEVRFGPGTEGLYRTPNYGETWQLVRPGPVGEIAASPADRFLVYAVGIENGSAETIDRSLDRGLTWTTAFRISHAASPCVTVLTLLQPHPNRLFTDAGCYAGRNLGTALRQTRDQGATWSTFFPDGQGLVPRHLIGGEGPIPTRFYLAADFFQTLEGAVLLRSDDDGATWTRLLQAPPGTATLGGLAYDPLSPDRLFIAAGRTPFPEDTGVRMSEDGGLTWSPLGRPDIGWVNHLLLSDDRSTLYASTNEGIWRYRFDAPESAQPAPPVPPINQK